MEFDYVIENSVFISDDDLDDMAEMVKKGIPIENVVTDYIACLDDFDYFCSYAYEDKVIDEVRKRVRALAD
jgi:hypothetical protein